MKRVLVKDLTSGDHKDLSLLGLNRYLYVVRLHQTAAPETLTFQKYLVLKSYRLEGTFRFDVLEKRDTLMLSEDQTKELKLYKLPAIMQLAGVKEGEECTMPVADVCQ